MHAPLHPDRQARWLAISKINRAAKALYHFPILANLLVVGVIGCMIANPLTAYASITNTRVDSAGTLEVAGSGWLSANGVDIYSNGNSASNDAGANCVSVAGAPGGSGCSSGSVYSGEKWQCVEMVNRLYLSRGWISSTWWGNGNTLKNNLPSGITYQNNGSITSLNPGDVITLDDGGDGHAGVINSVSGSSVQIANQNTVAVYSSATYSSNSITMTGWAGYTVQGVADAPSSGLANTGVQQIMDGSGDVWARNNIGYYGSGGWTEETGSGEKAIAAGSSGFQMVLDGSGNVWAQTSVGSSWTQETSGGGIQAIAAGANNQQMIVDSVGQVWAMQGITYEGGWTQETPSGEKPYVSMGDNGVEMIMDGSGDIWAKNSIGYGGWTQETPSGEVKMSAGDGGLQMIEDSSGDVWARNNIGYYGSGGWTQETPSGEVDISAGNGGLQMITDGSGDVWAKNSIGYGSWTEETGSGEGPIAAGDNSQQVIMDGSGDVWAENSITYGTWTQETPSGETAIAAGG